MEHGRLDNLPVEQIHQFWDAVEQDLRTRGGFGEDGSVRAILRYRNEIERVGPLVYHREPGDVADDIISGGYAKAERQAG